MSPNMPPVPGNPGIPPRKKTSPVTWIVIGLGGFFVLGILLTMALGFFAYHKMKQAGFDITLLEKKPELAFLKMALADNPDAEIVSIDEARGIATIRDKKTGKVVTMNFEDIRKGKFTFESGARKATIQTHGDGGQGSLEVTSPEGIQLAAGPEKLPAWLPAYAGAKLEGISIEGSGGTGGGFGFKSSDAPEKVMAFYESALTNAGFTVETTKHSTGAMLTAEAGTRKVTMNISAEGTGTSVSGTFEDK